MMKIHFLVLLLIHLFASVVVHSENDAEQQVGDTTKSRLNLLELERNRPGMHRGVPVDPDFAVPYENHPFDPIQRKRQLQTDRSSFEPVRIKFYTDTLESNNPNALDKIDWIKTNIFIPAAQTWSNLLAVYPVSGNLILSQTQLLSGMYCALEEFGQVPESHYTSGIPNTDIIFYVAGVNDPNICAKDTLAVAILCNTDQYDRPIAGAINLCLDTIDVGNTDPLDFIQVVVHEMAHVFGFSSNSFPYFWDPSTGKPRTSRPFYEKDVTCVDGSVRNNYGMPDENTLVYGTDCFGKKTAILVTPVLQAAVRNQFNCQSMIGAPLENQPTNPESCVGDHWEDRLFATEIMAPVKQGVLDSVLSALTLALLEDSGWYVTNYTNTHTSVWGLGAGCDFVEQPCLIAGSPPTIPSYAQGFFCESTDGGACSADHSYKQGCTLLQYTTALEDPYFTDDPTKGGTPEMDYCPLYSVSYTYSDGSEPRLNCQDSSNQPSVNTFREQYGSDSQCIVSDKGQGLCYETQCSQSDMKMQIKVNDNWITCNSDFETHKVSFNVGFTSVTLTCPRLAQACPELFCPYNCAGRGVCDFDTNTCKCFDSSDTSPGCINTPLEAVLGSRAPTISPAPVSSNLDGGAGYETAGSVKPTPMPRPLGPGETRAPTKPAPETTAPVSAPVKKPLISFGSGSSHRKTTAGMVTLFCCIVGIWGAL